MNIVLHFLVGINTLKTLRGVLENFAEGCGRLVRELYLYFYRILPPVLTGLSIHIKHEYLIIPTILIILFRPIVDGRGS